MSLAPGAVEVIADPRRNPSIPIGLKTCVDFAVAAHDCGRLSGSPIPTVKVNRSARLQRTRLPSKRQRSGRTGQAESWQSLWDPLHEGCNCRVRHRRDKSRRRNQTEECESAIGSELAICREKFAGAPVPGLTQTGEQSLCLLHFTRLGAVLPTVPARRSCFALSQSLLRPPLYCRGMGSRTPNDGARGDSLT
jgi:hypothetical protein